MKERRAYWDNLKGLLMILVVVAHFMQTNTIVSQAVYAGIYFFHMPLFIFVSGVFQHGRIKERVTSLVAIGIVYNAVLILVDNVMIGVQQEFYVFRATKIPWFVFSVALCDLMTYVVRDFDKRFVLTFSFLIGLVACYDANLVSYMSIAKAVGWFPFYYLGYLLGPDMMDMPKKKRVVLILGGGDSSCVYLCGFAVREV